MKNHLLVLENKENTEEIKALNTMSIYSHNYGVSLVQDYIEDKSNEIPMGPELIKKLKDFEKKYGELYKEEKNDLLKFKAILLDLDTGNNGIKNIYEKMSNMYFFIEDY